MPNGYEKIYLKLLSRLIEYNFKENAARLGLEYISEQEIRVNFLKRDYIITKKNAESTDGKVNLKKGYEILPNVSLRINIDKSNLTSGDEVYNYLKENSLLDKITPYYGKVSVTIQSQC